jgi:hypothetical protein
MADRFFDTELCEKEWYHDLTPIERCFFRDVLLSKCDCVGVWVPNRAQVEYLVGPFDFKSFPDRCNGNIEILPDGKWWLVDFCDFQYGELTEACKPHKKYIAVLRRYGLLDRVLKGYGKGIDTLQEKEEEKEKDKEQEKEEKREECKEGGGIKRTYGEYKNVRLTDEDHQKLLDKYGEYQVPSMIERLSCGIKQYGYEKKYKDHYLTLLNWARRDKIPEVPKVSKCKACGSPMDGDLCSNRECPTYGPGSTGC